MVAPLSIAMNTASPRQLQGHYNKVLKPNHLADTKKKSRWASRVQIYVCTNISSASCRLRRTWVRVPAYEGNTFYQFTNRLQPSALLNTLSKTELRGYSAVDLAPYATATRFRTRAIPRTSFTQLLNAKNRAPVPRVGCVYSSACLA